jgi:hypothetical protein
MQRSCGSGRQTELVVRREWSMEMRKAWCLVSHFQQFGFSFEHDGKQRTLNREVTSFNECLRDLLLNVYLFLSLIFIMENDGLNYNI